MIAAVLGIILVRQITRMQADRQADLDRSYGRAGEAFRAIDPYVVGV